MAACQFMLSPKASSGGGDSEPLEWQQHPHPHHHPHPHPHLQLQPQDLTAGAVAALEGISEDDTTPPAGGVSSLPRPGSSSSSAFYSSLPVDIKDPLSNTRPLRPFDRSAFEAAFPPSSPTSTSAGLNNSIPPSTSSSSNAASSASTSSSSSHPATSPRSEIEDPFLYPFLPQNERKRLHEFWYLTSGLHEDTTLATHLSSLLAVVRDLYGFDIALFQFIDNDRSSSLTPDGWQSTCYPRRETGCAHTMLLQPGTVLNIPDFFADPRFAKNPQIVAADMRSYAGVPLAYTIQGSGESVSLGSLCVMSLQKTRPPLSMMQQKSLARFADIAMHAIKDRTRLRREAAQTRRHELLSILSRIAGAPSAVVEATLATLVSTFGGAKASFVESKDKTINLQGVGSVSISEFQGGIWENASVIEDFIKYHNHESSTDYDPQCTVRAIAVPLTNVSDHFLLVESGHLRDIFDGSDVLFVHSCAMVIAGSIQDGLLRQALEAKTTFLRNVQHAFRTSLNGILSATDMLLGEGASYINGTTGQSRSLTNGQPPATTPLELLRIIETSGRGLLTVINHLIDLDAQNATAKTELCDLSDLEGEVLDSIVQYSSKEKMKDILLISDSQTSGATGDCIVTDRLLLRQAISALVQNAVEATSSGGMIMVKISLSGQYGADQSLDVEVRDTGVGIDMSEQDRIFQPFEKINIFTPNAGLGLTFACQYAATLGGSVALMKSDLNKGSLFRLRLPSPIIASSLATHKARKRLPKDWTYWMNKPFDQHGCEHIYGNTLQSMGITLAPSPAKASIIVQPMTQTPTSSSGQSSSDALGSHQILLMLGWEEDYHLKDGKAEDANRTVFCRLPWTRSRLIATIMQAQKMAKKALDPTTVHTPLEDLKSLSFTSALQTTLFNLADLGTVLRRPQKIHALLVDDNAMNLNILQAYCKKRKYGYSSARDGKEAFAIYKAACEAGRPPSICLLDLQMPVMDGITCAKMIRAYELQENRTRCPIIMVTAQSGDVDRKSSIEAGTDAYYVKPLRISTLDDVIARYARV